MATSISEQDTDPTTPEGPRKRTHKEITFKGGLDEPFHRWFRLTPSFSPVLVKSWLSERSKDLAGVVLDPFAGAGTTCIVAAELGFSSVGFEINPLLAMVSRVSTSWSLSPSELANDLINVRNNASRSITEFPDDPERFAEALDTTLPRIHNVYRWWRSDVLRELLAIREAVRKHGGRSRDHLNLALAQIVYPTASITLGRLQIAFRDRTNDLIEPLSLFCDAAAQMIEDLGKRPSSPGIVSIINGDSKSLIGLSEQVGAVFCSPPYPNRYSYVWNTRPHLYLLEMIEEASEAADIDIDTIGGTWGRATSDLQKGRIEPTPNVNESMCETLNSLANVSLFMHNYVCKYFNDLDLHLHSLRSKLETGVPIGYVVGNSETNGVLVQTHEILAQLFELNGFALEGIDYLRARNSGAGLVEATVSGRAS